MPTTSATRRKSPVSIPVYSMRTLGVTAPYTVTNVKKAYLAKAKLAHPDTGGDSAAFIELQEAFEEALDYAIQNAPRWNWKAAMAEILGRQQALVAELRKRGAIVETAKVTIPSHAWGEDNAFVTERIVAIHLCGPSFTDEALDLLVRFRSVLYRLRRLNLSGSQVTDKGIAKLFVFSCLKELDLRHTAVTRRGLEVVKRLPELRVLDLQNTPVGWFTRLAMRWSYRGLRLSAPVPRKAKPARSPLPLVQRLNAWR